MVQPAQGRSQPLTFGSIEVPPEIRVVFERISGEIAALRAETSMLQAKLAAADEALNGIQHKERRHHEEVKRLNTADNDADRRMNRMDNAQAATRQIVDRTHVFQVGNQGDEIPPHGACEILGKSEGGDVYLVSLPTADSLSPGRVLFAGAAGIPAASRGVAFSALDMPVDAAAGSGYADIEVGDTLGTKAGHEYLEPGNAGFVALTPGPWFCRVRADAQANPVAVAVFTGEVDSETNNPMALLYQGKSGDVLISKDENGDPVPVPVAVLNKPEGWEPEAGTQLVVYRFNGVWEGFLLLSRGDVDATPQMRIIEDEEDPDNPYKLQVRMRRLVLRVEDGITVLAPSEGDPEEEDDGWGEWFTLPACPPGEGDTGTGDTGTGGGEQGDTGEQGEKGDTGIHGEQGDTGPQGDTGIQGEQGDTGATGDTGIQGEKGDTGAEGVKGDTGAAGNNGIDGFDGEKGDTGVPGENGVDGFDGEDGDKGDKGDTGIQGEKGDTGAGEKGDTGSPGDLASLPDLTADPIEMIGKTALDVVGWANVLVPNSGVEVDLAPELRAHYDDGQYLLQVRMKKIRLVISDWTIIPEACTTYGAWASMGACPPEEV